MLKQKIKTCSQFSFAKRIRGLALNNAKLPWVHQAKYLGNEIEDIPTGLSKDVKIKRARFIERNVEICQEFSYAHP